MPRIESEAASISARLLENGSAGSPNLPQPHEAFLPSRLSASDAPALRGDVVNGSIVDLTGVNPAR
jgi:hypothetical protein